MHGLLAMPINKIVCVCGGGGGGGWFVETQKNSLNETPQINVKTLTILIQLIL